MAEGEARELQRFRIPARSPAEASWAQTPAWRGVEPRAAAREGGARTFLKMPRAARGLPLVR